MPKPPRLDRRRRRALVASARLASGGASDRPARSTCRQRHRLEPPVRRTEVRLRPTSMVCCGIDWLLMTALLSAVARW